MDNKYTHVRLLRTTARKLKKIGAETNETIIQVAERLTEAEMKRLGIQQKETDPKE
ncbi:MAG: hypothetical protein IPL32_18355 [Chloracidobacterium sp.]|nr:hypothetical protein [Chloracidobacterium sp.]